jgi:hypothetical protein
MATNASNEKLSDNYKHQTTILKNLEKLDTFADRITYADKHLKRLSSGSSRIVFVLPDNTVLKLAKNKRGLKQNEAESNSKMKSKFLNKILAVAKNFAWINTRFLDKIKEKDFEKMTGINFKDFGEAIKYGLQDVSDNDKIKPKNFDKVCKSEIYQELERLGKRFKLMPGDIARISSWGTINGIPILIDAGLTKEIFDKYYKD